MRNLFIDQICVRLKYIDKCPAPPFLLSSLRRHDEPRKRSRALGINLRLLMSLYWRTPRTHKKKIQIRLRCRPLHSLPLSICFVTLSSCAFVSDTYFYLTNSHIWPIIPHQSQSLLQSQSLYRIRFVNIFRIRAHIMFRFPTSHMFRTDRIQSTGRNSMALCLLLHIR